MGNAGIPVDESKYYIGGCLVEGNEPDYKCITCNWEGSELSPKAKQSRVGEDS
jgi:hypothetical protein